MLSFISSAATTILTVVVLSHGSAWADEGGGGKTLNCDYKFYGMDFAKVQIYIFPNGKVASSATISNQGASHKESVTAETLGAGEYLHVWISKENPQNAIEMIAYSAAKAEGDSVLINHNMPMGQDVWGSCAAE